MSQNVIDLADGDPIRGNVVFGSPLAIALATRGSARLALGQAGWRDDYAHALAMAREADPNSYTFALTFTYGYAIPGGVLQPDDVAMHDLEEALEITERSGEDFAVGLAHWALGIALLHRDSPTERERGLAVLERLRDMCLDGRHYSFTLPLIEVCSARERARRGDRDVAISQLRAAIDDLIRSGQLGSCVPATDILVQTLLERGADGDVIEAEAAVARLARVPADEGTALRDIWLQWMHALLARAHGDVAARQDHRRRLRRMVTSLGLAEHMAWVEDC